MKRRDGAEDFTHGNGRGGESIYGDKFEDEFTNGFISRVHPAVDASFFFGGGCWVMWLPNGLTMLSPNRRAGHMI